MIYIALPRFIADSFSSAGKIKRPTQINKPSLIQNSNRWRKVLNNVGDNVVDPELKTFKPKSLESMFAAIGKGIALNLEVAFKAKGSTQHRESLKPSVFYVVRAELVRRYIPEVNQDIGKLARMDKSKPKIVPKAVTADFANDNLLAQLANMGL